MAQSDLIAAAAQGGTGNSEEISEDSKTLYRELISGNAEKLEQLDQLARASKRLEKPEELPAIAPRRHRWWSASSRRAA
jgi:hypothetical protein